MDRLASMAAFVKAAEVGSFAAAASALRMSPQMVAKHVTWLETRLGTRLLNRTTRRQSLTDIGKAYYDRCKLVLADADWADSLADEAKGAPRGRLRINAPVSFGAHSLTPVIARYLRQHPRVEVDLVLSDRFVDLVEEEFEAVFRVGPLVDSSFVARELAPFRLVACASPDYLRERGAPATPLDLETHECLVYASTSGPIVNDWRFVRDKDTYTVDVKHRLQVNDAKALLIAALNGFGIAFIAEDLAREGLRSGRLTKVLPDYETPSRPIHLIYHPDRRQTSKLKSFISAVVSELG
ncbi:LysR family transcriptional regulator [Bradyrhizobium sp. USDA 4451]